MKRICHNKVVIDALTVCMEVENGYFIDQLVKLESGDSLDLYDFSMTRIDGRYFENVYQISYQDGCDRVNFGLLKFNLANGKEESNVHVNGMWKVWISLDNQILYRDDIHYLSYIAETLCLKLHNITSLDLALDTSFNTSKTIRKYLRDKSVTTILNGKRINDRDADRPEIVYINSGSLNKDKYMTVNIKQKKAIKDKSNGITLLSYDKKAEVLNGSGKQYILDYYDNPKRLFRTEVHLNNEDIRDFLERNGIELNYALLYNDDFLEIVYFYFIKRVLRFQSKSRDVEWEDILGRSQVYNNPPCQMPHAH